MGVPVYFERKTTLRLARARNGKVKLLHEVGSHDFSQTNSYGTSSQDPSLRKPFDRALRLELQLLRVCRQLHQEAASMLYSTEFCIAKKLDAHLRTHDATGHYVNQTSTVWLRRLGQHKAFIKKLVIDLGSVCPPRCYTKPSLLQTFRPNDECIQFGGLLQAIWADELKMVVSFVYQELYTAPVSQGRTLNQASTTYRSPISAENITTMFQALARDDLGMKKFRHAIGDIGIEKHGEFGIMVFWTPQWLNSKIYARSDSYDQRNPLLDHSHRFSLGEDGRIALDEVKPPKLLSLPRTIINKIIGHTLDSFAPQEIDLDSFTDLRDMYGILYATKDLHDQYLTSYLRKNTFKISLMISNARASFGFGKLDRLLRTELTYRVGNATRGPYFGNLANCFIDLHVHFGTSDLVSSLKNIRINVMPLVASTFAASRHKI